MENSEEILAVMKTGKAKDGHGHQTLKHRFKMRGIEQVVNLAPTNFGGCNLLKVVYAEGKAAELVHKREEMDNDGRKSHYDVFNLRNADKKDGAIYECQVKPWQKTDKTLLRIKSGGKIFKSVSFMVSEPANTYLMDGVCRDHFFDIGFRRVQAQDIRGDRQGAHRGRPQARGGGEGGGGRPAFGRRRCLG